MIWTSGTDSKNSFIVIVIHCHYHSLSLSFIFIVIHCHCHCHCQCTQSGLVRLLILMCTWKLNTNIIKKTLIKIIIKTEFLKS